MDTLIKNNYRIKMILKNADRYHNIITFDIIFFQYFQDHQRFFFKWDCIFFPYVYYS